MEGPSLLLAEEQLAVLKGQTVRVVSGNTKIGKERFLSKEVKDIFSWGKHLVFQFDTFAFRVHFLLFGTYEATVNGISVTGDYKRTKEPRLTLEFDNGEIKQFNCSIKIFEDPNLEASYDFSLNIMSTEWDSDKALQHVLNYPDEEIADILLDQEIFAGVGNIIKNEVLSIVKIHPQTKMNMLSENKLKEIITVTQKFSHQFYKWRKEFKLRVNLKIHRKSMCPHCGRKATRQKTGKRQRWSYFCSACQLLS